MLSHAHDTVSAPVDLGHGKAILNPTSCRSGRREAFEDSLVMRTLEADGYSTAVRALAARIGEE
jgi:hypothetical protein